MPDRPGWIEGAPPLAVEHATRSQDSAALRDRIRDILEWGTRWVWVVRLVGPRVVEVHEPGREPVIRGPGEVLDAPGVLQNPVPVEALFDQNAAREAALRNILQRTGYRDIDEVREEGPEEGELRALRSALLDAVEARGDSLAPADRERIDACADRETLRRWFRRALGGLSGGAPLN